MQCENCRHDSGSLKAHYCTNCGSSFSNDARQHAYNQTIYGKIDRFLETSSWLTLKKITDNIFVRLGILLILGLLVWANVSANGKTLAIKNGENYSIAYNEQADEYYILTDEDSVSLSVYIPKKAVSCVLESYIDGALSEQIDMSDTSSSVVHSTEHGYFRLCATYENGESESVLFFVCREDAS